MTSDPISPPPRRGRPGYDLESLLAVVVRVFNDRGYDGTSMEHLARALGIGKSAIYHHVRSKEELLELALERALEGLLAAARSVETFDGRAVDRLRHLVRSSVVVLVERLPFVTLLLRVRGNTEVERAALEHRRRLDRFTADLVRQAVAEGDLRADVEPAVTARLLFGMVNSLVEWYRPDGGLDAEHLADIVTSAAFEGLAARPAHPGEAPPSSRRTSVTGATQR